MIQIRPRIKVLWIEDSTRIDLSHLIPPVRLSGEYDLTIARNATDAVKMLKDTNSSFDIIIFDLDLLPGSDSELQKYYRDLTNTASENFAENTLGAQLLRLWIKEEGELRERYGNKFKLEEPLSSEKIGILSVFAEDFKSTGLFEELGIPNDVVKQKEYSLKRRELLDLVEKIKQKKEGDKNFSSSQ